MNADWQALKRNVAARQQAEAALATIHAEMDRVRVNAAAELAKANERAAEDISALRNALKAADQSIASAAARYSALQANFTATSAELSDVRAEAKALEKMRNALEQNIEVMRKEHAEQQKIFASMMSDMRATAEATRVPQAHSPLSYTLDIVDRDANNDMRRLRIVPSKGGE